MYYKILKIGYFSSNKNVWLKCFGCFIIFSFDYIRDKSFVFKKLEFDQYFCV